MPPPFFKGVIMAITTKFDICSNALIQLGAEPIASFDDGTAIAQICATVYPEFKLYTLSMYPWLFTMKKQQLARLLEAPLNEYRYAFQLPTDMLTLRTIYDSGQVGAVAYTRYEIFGDGKVFSDSPELYADYQFEVDENKFPHYFVEFMSTAFAAKIAMAVTENEALAQLKHTQAFGSPSDNLSGGMYGVSKRIDSQQQSPQVTPNFDLLAARFGSW
jgi:hypothetical protein